MCNISGNRSLVRNHNVVTDSDFDSKFEENQVAKKTQYRWRNALCQICRLKLVQELIFKIITQILPSSIELSFLAILVCVRNFCLSFFQAQITTLIRISAWHYVFNMRACGEYSSGIEVVELNALNAEQWAIACYFGTMTLCALWMRCRNH